MSTKFPANPEACLPKDLGSAVAELGARIVELDPEFGRMSIDVGQEAWSMPGLSPREKAFLCLANDTLYQHLGLPLRMHVEMAPANAVSRQDLREVVRHLAPYAGYPACVEAFVRLAEIVALRYLDAPYASFVVRQAEHVWNRSHLSHLERAYLSLADDVCHQTLDESFQPHVDLALKRRQPGASARRAAFPGGARYGQSVASVSGAGEVPAWYRSPRQPGLTRRLDPSELTGYMVQMSDGRTQILEAAFEEFAAKGYHGATIKSIAAVAGLQSPALIYWYFPDKEGLFREVLSSRLPILRSSIPSR